MAERRKHEPEREPERKPEGRPAPGAPAARRRFSVPSWIWWALGIGAGAVLLFVSGIPQDLASLVSGLGGLLSGSSSGASTSAAPASAPVTDGTSATSGTGSAGTAGAGSGGKSATAAAIATLAQQLQSAQAQDTLALAQGLETATTAQQKSQAQTAQQSQAQTATLLGGIQSALSGITALLNRPQAAASTPAAAADVVTGAVAQAEPSSQVDYGTLRPTTVAVVPQLAQLSPTEMAVVDGASNAPLSAAQVGQIQTAQGGAPLTAWQKKFLETGGNTTIPAAPGSHATTYVNGRATS